MRQCPFKGCKATIADSKFSCPPHWYKLSVTQRAVIWAAYRDYQADKIDVDGLRRIQKDILAEYETGAQVTARVDECTACKAPIWWFRTSKAGAPCPIDVEPVKDGNIVLRDNTAVYLTQSMFDEEGKAREGELRYRSHFVTCPQADKFRHTPRKAKK